MAGSAMATVNADKQLHLMVPHQALDSRGSDGAVGCGIEAAAFVDIRPRLRSEAYHLFDDVERHERLAAEEGDGNISLAAADRT